MPGGRPTKEPRPLLSTLSAARPRLPIPVTGGLLMAAFVCDFSIGMVALATQNLGIYVLDAPNAVLGLFATLSACAYAVGCMFAGSISDRFGRRRCLVAGCLGAATVWLLLPHMGSWQRLLLLLWMPGASLSLFWPSLQAWLAELSESPRALSRNLGHFNIVWSMGLMLGPVATGYVWQVGHGWAFVLPAVALMAMTPVALLTPRGRSQEHADAPESDSGRADGDLFLWLAWIGNFAAWFAGGVIMALFPKLGFTLHYSEPHVGWLLFSFRVGQVVMFVLTLYMHHWQYRLWPLVGMEALAVGGMALSAVAGSSALFATAFTATGLCAGMTYVSSLYYSLHGRARGKGRTSGFHEAVLGSGSFLGPLLGGLLAQYLSLRAPFTMGAGVMAAAMLAQLVVAQRMRRRLRANAAVGVV